MLFGSAITFPQNQDGEIAFEYGALRAHRLASLKPPSSLRAKTLFIVLSTLDW